MFKVDSYGAKFPPLLHFIKKYKVPWILKWQYDKEGDVLTRCWYVKWWDKFPHTQSIINNVTREFSSPSTSLALRITTTFKKLNWLMHLLLHLLKLLNPLLSLEKRVLLWMRFARTLMLYMPWSRWYQRKKKLLMQKMNGPLKLLLQKTLTTLAIKSGSIMIKKKLMIQQKIDSPIFFWSAQQPKCYNVYPLVKFPLLFHTTRMMFKEILLVSRLLVVSSLLLLHCSMRKWWCFGDSFGF